MGYAHLVEPGRKIKMSDFSPDDCASLDAPTAEEKISQLVPELVEIQDLLSAAKKNSVLIVLQGPDTSGKNGTISKVIGPLNSQGCQVVSFKIPTYKELSHDFLWRVHNVTPALGEITVFNRSHYEDVLVARVRKLVTEKSWRARYNHINNFEHLLTDTNTIIFKFYLHISKQEQQERMLAREQDPTKYWKLSINNWKDQELWDEYTEAYEQAINNCSNLYAPWYIVPANKTWFRDLAVIEAIVNTLRPYKKGWLKHLDDIGKRKFAALNDYRKEK